MQKLQQWIFKWGPTGFGLGTIAHFVLGHEWTQAVIATFLTACTSLWVKFSGKFMARLEEAAEERGEQSADWVIAQLDRLPAKVRWLTSGFEERYRQSLVDKYGELATEGFRIGLPVLNLEDVFVPLRVVTEIPEKIPGAMVSLQVGARSQGIWEFLKQSPRISAYRRLAVIGPPGSGKTTLLKYLTLSYAQTGYRKYQAPKLIPVLLYLRDIRHQILGERVLNLSELIANQIQSLPTPRPLKPSPNWISEQLKNGTCLVMLDGLDEVADESQRLAASQWVNQQMKTYGRARFILTSRPDGYRSAPVERVGTVLEVLPFTSSQTRQSDRNQCGYPWRRPSPPSFRLADSNPLPFVGPRACSQCFAQCP
ncbi:MAG: NACHT domain-containing protein, partial [Cyanothece sp. SIO1E1]|nr:NACHT domain-containing protein [Cyanothece sp. SIO1E1]